MQDDTQAPGRGGQAEGSPNFDTMTTGEVMAIIEEGLAHLGVEDLTRVVQLTEERRKERQDEARESLLKEFRDRAAEMGMSLDTLFPSGREGGRKRRSDAGQPLPVKYRSPTGDEWSGRGHPPRWLTALLAEGRKKEEFQV